MTDLTPPGEAADRGEWRDGLRIEAWADVRGEVARVSWDAGTVEGPAEVLERLARTAGHDIDDPVGFLMALRDGFGDDVTTRIVE
ncbi:MAG: hypothetical protein MUE36_15750 [Acidimicrobiales bacterium]|nr:hypothetical protein [Acidimicrobiales bacterium]